MFVITNTAPSSSRFALLLSLASLALSRVFSGNWVLASLGGFRASQYVPALACHLSVSLQSFALFRSSLPVALRDSAFVLHFTRSLPFIRSSFAFRPRL